MIMTIWFASGNIHKKKELSDILSAKRTSDGNVRFDLRLPSEAGFAFDPDETGNTFLENALIKAEALYRLLLEKGVMRHGEPVIADDSGICVDSLDGRPGIYSARYGMSAHGTLSDTGRNALLLAELGDNPTRSARFVCAMVLYYSPNRFFAAQESLEGELVPNEKAARGSGGFGYDPILYIPGLGRTVAELDAEEKNRLSHRAKAGMAIAGFLLTNHQHGGPC